MANKWERFTGSYEKKQYDIWLKDGTKVMGCWPNAGTFHSDGEVYDGKQVVYFRLTE